MHDTKQRLITAGLRLMLERGYHAVGIQDLLDATDVPKGSFYHHFESKEDFALQVIDAYQANVRDLIHATVDDPSRAPLDRVRAFFDGVRTSYESEGYLGCFLGALGQELSGTSEIFRSKIDGCISFIAAGLSRCIEDARIRGELPASTDSRAMGELLANAWEGAALRSRLTRSSQPLEAVLDFFLTSMVAR